MWSPPHTGEWLDSSESPHAPTGGSGCLQRKLGDEGCDLLALVVEG